MNEESPAILSSGDADLAVWTRGRSGSPVVLLHGLAGSSRELFPTAEALTDRHRVILIDQRGHGQSTRHPGDVARRAFVDDVVAVIKAVAEGEAVDLVGQSMGAHTAFLVAHERPDLVRRLIMLEGHVAGSDDPGESARVGDFFRSWPVPFADAEDARSFLGDGALSEAWIADLEATPDGLVPRFDPDVMHRTLEAVHEPRWTEWEGLAVPTTAVFAAESMFSEATQDGLFHRRPDTERVALAGGTHDAHLDAFDEWVRVLRERLSTR